MAWNRFWPAVVAALALVQTVRAQPVEYVSPGSVTTNAKGTGSLTCKVYSLAELGDDAKLCKWIAETIPDMIEPASWKQPSARLSYFAPSQILVINNTAEVHGRVEEFLQNLRKTAARKPASTRQDGQVMPAQFLLQDTSRPTSVVQTGPASYPVPAAAVGPKHLFHFIIRYEGEGVIDSNVAAFVKSLTQDKADAATSSYIFPPACAPQPMSSPLPAPVVKPERTVVGAITPAPPPPPAMPPADNPPTGWRLP